MSDLDYSIKAVETLYSGHLFRSKLEATWAAFFDLCGWGWEYEPFMLNGWLPDFALMGEKIILVEVKPIFNFPSEVADKIEQAQGDNKTFNSMIVGCGINDASDGMGRNLVGWIREFDEYEENWVWDEMVLRLWDEKPGFTSPQVSFHDRMSGEYDGSLLSRSGDLGGYKDDASYFHALWGRAKNITRYVHRKKHFRYMG